MHLTNPVSYLRLVQQEIDRAFGVGYAASRPENGEAATADWAPSDWRRR